MSQTTPVGFEPTRGDPIGLAGRLLNHSAKVSSGDMIVEDVIPYMLARCEVKCRRRWYCQ